LTLTLRVPTDTLGSTHFTALDVIKYARTRTSPPRLHVVSSPSRKPDPNMVISSPETPDPMLGTTLSTFDDGMYPNEMAFDEMSPCAEARLSSTVPAG
jgi:hypothetical protein